VLYKKSQSILEYAILIAIIVAAILIMQTFMKRGVQGRLKDSSEKISGGESYSASDSTILEDRGMTSNRQIDEATSTGDTSSAISGLSGMASGLTVRNTGDAAYSASAVSGGDTTSKTLAKTSSAANETFAYDDYNKGTSTDFDAGDFDTTAADYDWTAPAGK